MEEASLVYSQGYIKKNNMNKQKRFRLSNNEMKSMLIFVIFIHGVNN